jgi:hypothetical protein
MEILEMKIEVIAYPTSFEFETKATFPKFDYGCDVRCKELVKAMSELDVNSSSHQYEDYIVEQVEVTKDGERWHLGS